MLKVALTGGIATGKTYVREKFEALGVPTIDADVLARDAVRPSSPSLIAVVARFGPTVLAPDGTLDRPTLANVIFADDQARKDLEAIIHPAVYTAIAAWLVRLVSKGAPPIAIADIPLLYETGHAAEFDRVVVSVCSEDKQVSRVMQRDGLSEEEVRKRIAAQLPIKEKARRADYVIDTNGSFENTERQVVDVLRQLRLIGPYA
jgi:dephospho-CoA kinase